MKGLILNNLYSVEKSIKSVILIAIAAVTLLIFTNNPTAFRLAIFLPFVLIPIQAFEVFKHDAISGWNKFEITLPVKRHKIIQSKYATFLLLYMISLLITFGLFFIAHLFNVPTFTPVFFNFLFRAMGLILCGAALTYPLTYILGTEKSDGIMISSMGFSFGIFLLVSILLQMMIGTIESFDRIFSISFLLVSILLYIISYFVSITVYKRKEF